MRTASSSRASDRPAPAGDRAPRWLAVPLALGALALGLYCSARGRSAIATSTAAPPARIAIEKPAAQERRAPIATPRPHAPIAIARARGIAMDPAPLPGSLRGTEEDGALEVGDDGDLVIGARVLRLFDYYLSAGGEE